MNNDPPAHIGEDGRGHGLEGPLKGAAELAASFEAEFGYGEWTLAGLWHDLGRTINGFLR